jgi:SSS family solute:Na+ symporter
MHATIHAIDWAIIGIYAVAAVALGSMFSRKASSSVDSFFVGGRDLPWWIAGTSIVATTFAADTPLAVTGIVASGGIAGNWIWWAWAIAHVVATFLFARMWRRSGVITDAEITELRYSGPWAAALRGFKAVYFGLFINCITMAWVIAAMVKISKAFFDWPAPAVIAVCVFVAVVYTILGGFRSVVATDMIQFVLGMAGAVALAWLALDAFGGIGSTPEADGSGGSGLLLELHTVLGGERRLAEVLAFLPGWEHPQMPILFFMALLICGWWRQAEGNGYVVQRLAACKDEGHAQAASLWFAVAHNALRPWPWFIVGLAALVAFPGLEDPEMGYPMAMGRWLPPGLLGVVIASLLAAFMSTIDTHTNWGASYLVQDVYLRFLRPEAGEREAVAVSRWAILLMALLAGITALFVQNIASVWVFIINLGAGLGSVTAARWYWSRVTPQAEFAALGVTTVLALGLLLFATPTLFGGPNPLFLHEIPGWAQILIIAGGSMVSWVPVALWGPRNDPAVLRSFAARVRPGGPGWAAWRSAPADPLLPAMLRVLAGLVVVYGALFGIGDWVLGRWGRGTGLLLLAVLGLAWILRGARARTQA